LIRFQRAFAEQHETVQRQICQASQAHSGVSLEQFQLQLGSLARMAPAFFHAQLSQLDTAGRPVIFCRTRYMAPSARSTSGLPLSGLRVRARPASISLASRVIGFVATRCPLWSTNM